MPETPPKPTVSDSRFEEAVAEYLRLSEEGDEPDAEQFLRRFPDLEGRLREFLAGLALFDDMADHLAPLAGKRCDGSPPRAGTRLGDFELLEELGRGGMGVVYRARQAKLDRLVALKLIRSGSWADTEERSRFDAEARAAARLQHPHIVQVFEVGEHDGLPYLALELVSGGSLARQCRGQPWEPRRAARLIETLAGGVQHAHEQNVVHRDLKPDNVLLTEDGTPKITDFGLARRTDVDAGHSVSGLLVGTPSYMAPEQTFGTGPHVGPAADVWALGALLYELLVGRPPFRGASVFDTLAQVRLDDPVPPSRLLGRLPRDLETVCLKCLRKQADKRYASAAALADDLGRFLRGEPIRARPVGAAERAWKWCRRNPVVASLLGLVVVTLLLGAAVAGFFAVRAERKADEARAEAGAKDRERQEADRQRRLAREETDAKERERQEALIQKNRAEREQRLAQLRLLDGTLYRVELIYQRNPAQARALLYDAVSCPPQDRDFTWGLYNRWCQRDRLTLRGHTNVVSCVVFSSPDGRTLASAGTYRRWYGRWRGEIKLWDAATGQERASLKGHKDFVHSVAYSPDGATLASGGHDGAVKLWDVATGQERTSLQGHQGWVVAVAFSPDGTTLASAGTDRMVKLWDVRTGQERAALKGHTNALWSVAFSNDGKTLASAGWDKTVRLWDAATGKELATLNGHTAEVRCVAFSPDDKTLVSAASDRTIKVWNAVSRQERLTLVGHTNAVYCLAFSPDGTTLASGSGGINAAYKEVPGEVRLWDARTWQERTTLTGHTGDVRSVCFSPDGKTLASAGSDRTIKLWEAGAGQERLTLEGHADPVWFVAFSPDGKTVAGASHGDPGKRLPGEIKLWDAGTGEVLASLKAHTSWITALAFSPDGKTLAAAGGDLLPNRPGEVRLWDVRSGQERANLLGHTGMVSSVCFSPDGETLASAGRDGTVRLWDVPTGLERTSLTGHTSLLHRAVFSPDGRTLASAGARAAERWYDQRRGEIKLWDVGTGRELAALQGHTHVVTSVVFSPDGQTVASASADRTIKLWDARTGQERATLKGDKPLFSPDGRTLAGAGEDYAITLWDTATGQERAVLRGHAGFIYSMSFSPDGKTLASASLDQTIKLWDAEAGQERASLKGHKAFPTAVVFSRDGRTLASASQDRTVKLWSADTEQHGP
jgi:WD40 repeat protein